MPDQHHFGFGCQAVPPDRLADPVAREFGLDADWLAHAAAPVPGLADVACGIPVVTWPCA